MKSLFNFFRYWKKHGWKKTKQEMKHNYYVLDTPDQLLTKQVYGHATTVFGFLIALVWTAATGGWWLWILFLGLTYLQWGQLKQTLSQRQQLRKMQEEADKLEGEDNGI